MNHCSCESRRALDALRTARGQIEATIRMIEEDRYCIDVSKQILAAQALLKKANAVIMRQHMDTCLADAVRTGDYETKLDEVMLILGSYLE